MFFEFDFILGIVEILVTYIQYFSLVNSIDVPWPHIWKTCLEWTHFLNLDLVVNLPSVPDLDYRAHYLLIVVAVPLAFSFIMLIFFKPVYVCIWFFLLLFSLALMAAGLILKYIPQFTIPTSFGVSYDVVIIVGAVGVGLCIVSWVLFWAYSKSRAAEQPPDEGEQEGEANEQFAMSVILFKYGITRSTWSHVSKLSSFVILLVLGLLFKRVIKIPKVDIYSGTRNVLDKIKNFLVSKFVRLILFFLMLFYIPFTSTIFSAWNCVDLTCDAGYRFLYKDPLISSKAQLIKTDEKSCEACNFIGTCNIAAELCPKSTDSRLVSDSSLSCDTVLPYFAPVSALMFIGIVAGIPLLFYYLTRSHYRLLKQMPVPDIVRDEETQGRTDSEKWNFRTRATKNSAKSLYSAFELNWRYYKVLLIFQKLILVSITIFILGWEVGMAVSVTGIHFIFFLFFATSTPFVSTVMDFVGNTTSLTLAGASLIAALLSFDVNVPKAVIVLVLVLAAILPFLAIFIGWFVNKRRERKVANIQDQSGDLTPRTIGAIDSSMNSNTVRMISSYAILLGILAFLGLAGAIIGFLASLANSKVYAPVTPDSFSLMSSSDHIESEFARYGSWEEFIDNCCCTVGPTDDVYKKLELWQCRNGYYKQRVRVSNFDNDEDGLMLRPFCGYSFTYAVCQGPHLNSDGKYAITACNSTSDGVSTFATKYLW